MTTFPRLEAFIQKQLTATHLPGISAAIIRDGGVIWARGSGFRDIANQQPATPDTLYGIASMTKSFTALAIMQMAAQGRLSVADPVSKHLPDFQLKPGGQDVRLWHFLTHTSGIPALAFSEQNIYALVTGQPSIPLATTADLLTFVNGAADWIHANPGEAWYYLNEGYSLLGAIIEQISGQTFAAYVTDHILHPLGMTRSFFDRASVEADPDRAVPYVVKGDQQIPGDYTYNPFPAKGGMISSTADMARYLQMILNGGELDGTRLISADSLREMHTPRITRPERGSPFGDAGYGYGWQITPDFLGHRVVEHGGSVLTATSHMAVVPDAGLGIVVLANGAGYPMNQLAFYGLAEALGRDPEGLPFVRRARQMDALGGIYRTYHDTMTFRVTPAGDLLHVNEVGSWYDERTIPLLPESVGAQESRFYVQASGVKMPVVFTDRDGTLEMLYGRYLFRKVGEL
jgi:CubicO group peptidase (beta-lactamase class C family)